MTEDSSGYETATYHKTRKRSITWCKICKCLEKCSRSTKREFTLFEMSQNSCSQFVAKALDSLTELFWCYLAHLRMSHKGRTAEGRQLIWCSYAISGNSGNRRGPRRPPTRVQMRGNVDDVDDVATFIKFTKKPERRACRHHSGRRNASTETVCFD